MRLSPYAEYKSSNTDWLGDIPKTWTTYRLKFIAPIQNARTEEQSIDLKYLALEHIESATGRVLEVSNTLEVESIVSLFRKDDILFNKLRPYLAKVVHANFDGVCTSELLVFRPSHILVPRYLFYFLISDRVISTVNSFAYGTKMPRVNWDQMANLPVPVASLPEQQAIADFLDRETAVIDTLIAKKRELIERLQEKRTALISRAVTKGLDLTVPMKDSGVEWLGDIPEHWECVKTKFVARLESGHTPSRQKPEYWVSCTIPWFSLADVWQIRDGRQIYVRETKEMISELGIANSAARLLPAGTVLLSRTASVGFSAIMQRDMATTQDFANWVCGDKILPEYLLFVFRSMQSEFKRLTMGSTHQTIYMPDIAQFVTPLPPLEEQQRIIGFIQEDSVSYYALVDNLEQAIKRLKEYRTALISAAVTGKIDVRQSNKG